MNLDYNLISQASLSHTKQPSTAVGTMSEASESNEVGPSTLPSGFESWRTSLAQFTGLGLTDEQRAEREVQKENGTLAKDWDRCEKWKRSLIESSECFPSLSPEVIKTLC